MENIRVVFITTPRDEGEKLARLLVENRLAACVNVVDKVKSFFWWDGAVQNDTESLLIAKTTQARFDELLIFVRKNHPYDLPEVIALPLTDAFADYVDWVKEVTDRK